jgi:hypothetical protein
MILYRRGRPRNTAREVGGAFGFFTWFRWSLGTIFKQGFLFTAAGRNKTFSLLAGRTKSFAITTPLTRQKTFVAPGRKKVFVVPRRHV